MSLLATLRQRLFRWQSDGTAPLRLGQRRIFILPSCGGLLYALALLAMLTGAINYNLALGHALVFLLVGLGIVGMIHTFRNLHGLLVTPAGSEPVFAGETAYFSLELDNDRPTPRVGLSFAAQPGLYAMATVDRKNRAKLKIPVGTARRGWLELPRVRLSTGYPLGLFTAWAYLHPAMRCLVYPRPIARPLPAPAARPSGGHGHGDGGQEDFIGFRERQPADSLRHVAWKASARDDGRGPLLVKQFAGGSEQELSLDWSLADPDQPDETRLGILTGWVLAAETAGLAYDLRLPGLAIPRGRGAAHRQRCLEALALYAP